MAVEVFPHPTPLGFIPEEADGLVIAQWSRVYLCYCFSRSEPDPMQMILRDGTLNPGDHLRPFLIWLPRQWARFLDITEPHWRAWDQAYRRQWRERYEHAFVDWLWVEFAPQGKPRVEALSNKELPDDK